jgi:putative transposase
MLRYKCDWYGKDFVLVDAFFPSARTCSDCGFENAEVGRKNALREWDCPACGARHDRGVNAAKNVLAEGMKQMSKGTAGRAETPGNVRQIATRRPVRRLGRALPETPAESV